MTPLAPAHCPNRVVIDTPPPGLWRPHSSYPVRTDARLPLGGGRGCLAGTLRSRLVEFVYSFIAVLALAGIHLGAGVVRRIPLSIRPTVASAAAGISVSWVFLELMPALSEHQDAIEGTGLLPGLERHVYIAALAGLVTAFWVETASRSSRRENFEAGGEAVTSASTFWLSLAGYTVFNASIGYALADPSDPAVTPYWIFVIAMVLHFLANDDEILMFFRIHVAFADRRFDFPLHDRYRRLQLVRDIGAEAIGMMETSIPKGPSIHLKLSLLSSSIRNCMSAASLRA